MVYQNFIVAKGDSLTFTITLTDAESAPDNIYLSIFRNAKDSRPVIQKYIGNGITRIDDDTDIVYEVYISSDETYDLELLNYTYGVKLVFGDEADTEAKGKLVITPERAVTTEVN